MSLATEAWAATASAATNGTVFLAINVLFNIMQHKTVELVQLASLVPSLFATALVPSNAIAMVTLFKLSVIQTVAVSALAKTCGQAQLAVNVLGPLCPTPTVLFASTDTLELRGAVALAPSSMTVLITHAVSLVFALTTQRALALALANGKVLIAVIVLLNTIPISTAQRALLAMKVVIPTATESARLLMIAVITPTLSLVM